MVTWHVSHGEREAPKVSVQAPCTTFNIAFRSSCVFVIVSLGVCLSAGSVVEPRQHRRYRWTVLQDRFGLLALLLYFNPPLVTVFVGNYAWHIREVLNLCHVIVYHYSLVHPIVLVNIHEGVIAGVLYYSYDCFAKGHCLSRLVVGCCPFDL